MIFEYYRFTVVLLGTLFYHRVSLFLAFNLILLALDHRTWRRWPVVIWLLVPLAIILVRLTSAIENQ